MVYLAGGCKNSLIYYSSSEEMDEERTRTINVWKVELKGIVPVGCDNNISDCVRVRRIAEERGANFAYPLGFLYVLIKIPNDKIEIDRGKLKVL